MQLNFNMPQLEAKCFPLRVLLVRHAESTFEDAQHFSGELSPGLSAIGARQTEILAPVLRSIDSDSIHSAGLQRTQTAPLPNAEDKSLSTQQHNALNDSQRGVWQGRFCDHQDPTARDSWRQGKSGKLGLRSQFLYANIPGKPSEFDGTSKEVGACWIHKNWIEK